MDPHTSRHPPSIDLRKRHNNPYNALRPFPRLRVATFKDGLQRLVVTEVQAGTVVVGDLEDEVFETWKALGYYMAFRSQCC